VNTIKGDLVEWSKDQQYTKNMLLCWWMTQPININQHLQNSFFSLYYTLLVLTFNGTCEYTSYSK